MEDLLRHWRRIRRHKCTCPERGYLLAATWMLQTAIVWSIVLHDPWFVSVGFGCSWGAVEGVIGWRRVACYQPFRNHFGRSGKWRG